MPIIRMAWIKVVCVCCKKEFEISPAQYRRRLKQTKSGKLFCSRKCADTDKASECPL